MTVNRWLARTAVKLHELWRREAAHDFWRTRQHFCELQARRRALAKAWRRAGKAEKHHLVLIGEFLKRDLGYAAESLSSAAAGFARFLDQSERTVPSLTSLAGDLLELSAEFEDVAFDARAKTVSVTTLPIVLEEVHLGAFRLRLHVDRLRQTANQECFSVEALQPHPASTDSVVVHPHVSGHYLCAGDASRAIQRALREGRVADAFCLVRSVLMHYNPSSAYVPLDRWDQQSCCECGAATPSQESYACGGCDQDYCSDCVGNCASCETVRCLGCLEACSVCGVSLCRGCTSEAGPARRICCSGCVESCAACGEEFASDELVGEARHCSRCHSAAAAPTAAELSSVSNLPIVEPNPSEVNPHVLDLARQETT